MGLFTLCASFSCAVSTAARVSRNIPRRPSFNGRWCALLAAISLGQGDFSLLRYSIGRRPCRLMAWFQQHGGVADAGSHGHHRSLFRILCAGVLQHRGRGEYETEAALVGTVELGAAGAVVVETREESCETRSVFARRAPVQFKKKRRRKKKDGSF